MNINNNPNFIMLLVIALAITVGLTLFFLVLGVMRVVDTRKSEEQFHDLINTLNQSELELERADANLPNPKTWSGYWSNLTIKAGMKIPNPSTPGLFVAGLTVFLALAGWFVWPGDILGGLIGAGVALFAARAYLTARIKARLVLMDKQLPGLLSGIRANLKAELTPQQAIMNQAKEVPAPLGEELRVLVEEMNVGVTLDTALRNFGQRVPSREVQFLVAAFRIAIKSGTDLDPLVEIIQDIVVQRQRIANALAAAVAQAQPAMWVTGIMIPAALIWSFYSSPENQAFWTSFPVGIVVMVIVAGFYGLGLFLVQKQVNKVKKG